MLPLLKAGGVVQEVLPVEKRELEEKPVGQCYCLPCSAENSEKAKVLSCLSSWDVILLMSCRFAGIV